MAAIANSQNAATRPNERKRFGLRHFETFAFLQETQQDPRLVATFL